MQPTPDFDATAASLRACRLCRDAPAYGPPLPQEPRPIVQGSSSARLCIASQAPGNKADKSGVPFMDPSGIRLRDWLGLDEAAFYDASRLAIVPMGACFPGYDAKGGDRPPRRECAERWRAELFAGLPFERFSLQPMDGPDVVTNATQAVDYCLRHPQWRLSVQTHKTLGIR